MATEEKYSYQGVSEFSKQIAMKELNENPDQINAHIESFRRWIKSMDYIHCPTDSQFLLRFLRVAKFDHNKAQKRIDNFCTVRSSPRGSPLFFKFHNVNDTDFQKFLSWRMHLPLGKNDAGELVLLVKPKSWNVEELPIESMAKCVFMDMDFIMRDEAVQIHGMQILIDMDGVSRKNLEAWADPKFAKQWHRIMQDSYPIRNKGQIFYKEPIIFDVVFQIMSFFMSDKMKSRTFRVKEDMTKACDKIPGLERVLPAEYGGKGGTISEIGDRWNSKLSEYYKAGNPLASISVDEGTRPKDAQKHLTEYGEYKGPTLGTSGTFTQFENVY